MYRFPFRKNGVPVDVQSAYSVDRDGDAIFTDTGYDKEPSEREKVGNFMFADVYGSVKKLSDETISMIARDIEKDKDNV